MKKLNCILIVDDDPICIFLLRKIIEKSEMGHKIISAQNGLDGIQKISEFAPVQNICPDLIFVDMEMPVMDGIEFIESFKEMKFVNKEKVEMIPYSSGFNEKYKEKLLSMNIHYYLQKPIKENIINEINEILQSNGILDELEKKSSSK